MRYAPYYRAEVQDGVVRRCEGSGDFTEKPEDADAAGQADGRPYVVADETGTVYVAPPAPAPTGRRSRS